MLKLQPKHMISKDKVETKKEEELVAENIRLTKKVKSLKLEVGALKMTLQGY
jgi:hypothetical protein